MFSMVTSALFAVICAGTTFSSDNAREGCNKAFEAASVQSGVEKYADNVRVKLEKSARERVSNEVATAAIAIWTIGFAREARISTGAVPYVQSTALVIRSDSTAITLSWSF